MVARHPPTTSKPTDLGDQPVLDSKSGSMCNGSVAGGWQVEPRGFAGIPAQKLPLPRDDSKTLSDDVVRAAWKQSTFYERYGGKLVDSLVQSHAADAFSYTVGGWNQAQSRTRLPRVPTARGDRVWQRLGWLKDNLPKRVYDKIEVLQPTLRWGADKLELSFHDSPTVVILPRCRREFMTDETIAHICLRAP